MKMPKIIGGALLSVAVLVGATAAPAMASQTVRPPATAKLSASRTATRFLEIAFTWKTSWYKHGEPAVAKRDARYASSTLDGVLKRVKFGGPETDANTTSITPTSGREVARRSLAGGALALEIRLTEVERSKGEPSFTFRLNYHVHVKEISGVWRVVGAHLPDFYGPSKYCKDVSAATAECNLFPA
jgi:hypothetical protein